MKKLILFVLAILPLITFAQKAINEKEVPQKFMTDFQNNYAKATNAKWYRVDSASYEVKFLNNEMKTSIVFRNMYIETRWEVKPEYVPATIKKYIDTSFSKAKIEYAYILDIPKENNSYEKEKSYEVGIKEKKEQYLLTFELNGMYKNTVKKEAVKATKKAKKEKK